MTIDPKTIAADIMTMNARDVTPSEVWAHIGQAYATTALDASIADEVADLIAKTGIDLIWPDGTANTELDAARVEIDRLRGEVKNLGMFKTRYFEVQELLDEVLGPDEEDGTGEGIVQEVALLAEQRDAAREQLAEAGQPNVWTNPAEPTDVTAVRDRTGQLWVCPGRPGDNLWWRDQLGHGIGYEWHQLLQAGPLTAAEQPAVAR